MKQAIIESNAEKSAMVISNDLVAKWLKYSQVSASSAKAYNKGINRLYEYLAENGINAPARDDLIAYREYLGGKYQPTTANLYLSAAKLFFDFLQVEGYISGNPASHLKGFKVNSTHKKSPLNAEMARAVIHKFDTKTRTGLRNEVIFLLAATCGLRTVEIARAKVKDLVVESGVIRLYVQGKGRLQADSAVNLPSSVFNLLKKYLAGRADLAADSPLFASESNRNKGGILSTSSISRILKKSLRAAGFDSPRLTAHSLRHTAATMALIAGATLREVQQLLRHSSINTTTIYLHELDALKNRAANLVAATFGF